jgi:sugar/nucleoside kinase (ribokinase family)
MVDRDEYNRIVAIDGGKDFLNNYDMSSVHKLGEKLLDYGAKIVLIKCGDKGCYLRTSDTKTIRSMGAAAPDNPEDWSDRELFEEIFKVPKVVSGTGAGDTCIAGFLAGLMRNLDAGESLKLACAVGAECVQGYGALDGIKPLEVTYQKVRDGWEKVSTALNEPYWLYDNNARVWLGRKDKLRK